MHIYFGSTSHLPRVITRNIYIAPCFCMTKSLTANFSHMNKITERRVLCSSLFLVREQSILVSSRGKKKEGGREWGKRGTKKEYFLNKNQNNGGKLFQDI